MCRSYNKNRLKPLSPNDFRVSGGGGKKTPLIGITTISGMPDYENALLMSDSTAGCLRITNKLPRLIGARTLCKRCLWHVLHRGRLSQIRSICVPYRDYRKCLGIGRYGLLNVALHSGTGFVSLTRRASPIPLHKQLQARFV